MLFSERHPSSDEGFLAGTNLASCNKPKPLIRPSTLIAKGITATSNGGSGDKPELGPVSAD